MTCVLFILLIIPRELFSIYGLKEALNSCLVIILFCFEATMHQYSSQATPPRPHKLKETLHKIRKRFLAAGL